MTKETAPLLRKSGSAPGGKHKEVLSSAAASLGQCYPQRCPPLFEHASAELREPLGTPLSIKEAATLIGCSAWTIRQRYLPAGLPHHRLAPNGKLIFYRNQIIRWLLTEQQKGVRIP